MYIHHEGKAQYWPQVYTQIWKLTVSDKFLSTLFGQNNLTVYVLHVSKINERGRIKLLKSYVIDETITLHIQKIDSIDSRQALTSHPLMQWSNSGCGYHFSPIVHTMLCKIKEMKQG